ncbi:MAG: methyltransferase [Pseudomonadota bacterium]
MVALPDGAPERRRFAPRDWFYRVTMRAIASPDFQSFATRFPLTRPFVRARARGLYDLVAGFVYSQTLLAVVQLDLHRILAERPLTAAQIGLRVNLDEIAAKRLAQAAVAVGLFKRRGERYRLSQTGAALIGAPGVEEMVRHHPLFYQDVADPVALLRRETDTNLSRYWGYVGGAQTNDMEEDVAAPYSALMAASQAMVADETLTTFPMQRYKRLLDVGGGEGAFLSAALQRNESLLGTVFDLPAVVERATPRFERDDVSVRADTAPGSFLSDPLPKGADLISLIRVCYDHEDDVVRALLFKIRQSLPHGGTLLISEPMSGGTNPTREGDAYFGFYTAAMSTGRPRSVAEHSDLLKEAGFEAIRAHKTRQPFITQVISARAG